MEWAGIREGEAVLDVGCGTGSATRFAAERAGTSGRVVGLDVNAGMIDVARSIVPAGGPEIEWVEHSAYELPFADGELDVVLFAQTLQFLQDRRKALAEARRVLAPGGRVVASLWCGIGESPYFDALVKAVSRHVGPETAAGLDAAFSLHDVGRVRALFREASFPDVRHAVEQLDLQLPPPHEFVPRHVSATPMATGFNEASESARQRVIQEVSERTEKYANEDGIRVPFRMLGNGGMTHQGSAKPERHFEFATDVRHPEAAMAVCHRGPPAAGKGRGNTIPGLPAAGEGNGSSPPRLTSVRPSGPCDSL